MLPYEELLGDAMAGNQTWFAREDYVEEAWRIIDPILERSRCMSINRAPGVLSRPNKVIAQVGGWWDPK